MPRSVPSLQPLFDLLALRRGDAAVMRKHQRFAGKFVERAGDALGQPAAVDEDQRGAVRAHQFEQLGMNRAPDGRALGPLRGGAAGKVLDLVEARHVFDRNLDAQIELLGRAGIDDGDRTVDDGSSKALRGRRRSSGGSAAGAFQAVSLVSAPPRKRATSSSGRCVAESPMRCRWRPQSCSRRSSESARCAPRLLGTSA